MPPSSNNLFEKHGYVVIHPTHPHAFAHHDGTAFFWNGDSEWFLLSEGVSDSSRNAAIDFLGTKQVNNLLITLTSGDSSLPVFPWLSTSDQTHFDLDKMSRWETAVERMMSKEMMADMWFYSDDTPWRPAAGSTEEDLYFRYLIARFGAYANVSWNLALEYQVYRTMAWVTGQAQFVKDWDPYDHIVGVHQIAGDTYDFPGESNLDHSSLQHFDRTPDELNSVVIDNRTAVADSGRAIPICHEEFFTETFADTLGGSVIDGRQKAWAVATAGGCYKTGSLGFSVGPSYTAQLHFDDTQILYETLTQTRWWAMAPANSLVASGGSGRYCLADTASAFPEYLVYSASGSSFSLDLAAVSGDVSAKWTDPLTGATSSETVTGGGVVILSNPFGSGESAVHVGGVAAIGLTVADTTASYGDTMRVAVRVGDTTTLGILAVELCLAFDANVLTSVDADTVGSMVSGWAMAENTVVGAGGIDTLKLALATAQDTLIGAGDLIYLDLVTADLREPGQSPLSLVRALINEGNPSPSVDHGSLIVTGSDAMLQSSSVVQADTSGAAGIPDTVRIEVSDSDLNVDPAQVDTVDVWVQNTVSGETEFLQALETDVSSSVFRVRLPSESGGPGADNDGIIDIAPFDTLQLTYTDTLTGVGSSCALANELQVINLFGDATLNGTVSAFDASRVLLMAVGQISPTTLDSTVCDVSGNGSVSALDASLVLQYNVSIIGRFPVQASVTASNHPYLKQSLSGPLAALGDLQAQSDGTYLLPLQLSEREGVVSGEMVVTYSGDAEVADVRLARGYESYLVAHRAEPGRVHVVLAGAQSTRAGAGEVIHLFVRPRLGASLRFHLEAATLNGQRVLTSPRSLESMVSTRLPPTYELHQNAPNPFNPSTSIQYNMAQPGEVRLSIYNIAGQHLRTLEQTHQPAGAYRLTWDGRDRTGRDVGSGVYLVRMETAAFTRVRKMLLLR